MKIYVPRPGLRTRVVAYEAEPRPNGAGWRRVSHPWYVYDFRNENIEWYRDEAPARAAADAATRKRIASLEAQITKLKGFLGEAADA